MLECPIVYYENNLIFDTQRSCWAVYRLNGFVYSNRSTERKTEYMIDLANLIANVTSEAKILIIPSHMDVKGHTKKLKRELVKDDPTYEMGCIHADNVLLTLQRRPAKTRYETYLIVKLGGTEADTVEQQLRDGLDALFRDPVNAVNTYMATSDKEILASTVRQMQHAAKEVLQEQSVRIAMEPATSAQIQFLLKRAMLRGREKDIQLNLLRKIFKKDGVKRTIYSDWVPFAQRLKTRNEEDEIIRPFKSDIVNLFRGVIKQKKRNLEIVSSAGDKTYQTFLTFAHIPDQLNWPDNEWIYFLQKESVQAEICIHLKNIEKRDAIHRTEQKETEITTQIENALEARAKISSKLTTALRDIEELKTYLDKNNFPLTKTCASICLFGESADEVDQKAKHVISTYKDMKCVIERPITDQVNLFLQHLPGAGQYVSDFDMILPPSTLAGGIFGVTEELGDTVGPYIGTAGDLALPVFLSMGLACLTNKSASMTIFGDLGYGKSFSANLLILLNVIYGGYSLIFDPKAERAHWAEAPFLQGLVNVVTLDTNQENAGKLDPFLIYKNDLSAAKGLALNVVLELYGLTPQSDEYIVLTEALSRMDTIEKPCMLALCQEIEAVSADDGFYESARRLARRLRSTRAAGLSMLLFGTGEEEAIRTDSRLNILQIANLKLPSAGAKKEEYDTDEKLSVVLMMVLGNFVKQFAHVKREVFSLILFDESWMLGQTSEGRKLYSYLSRMGRSLYTGCIFNGHSVLDISDEGVRNTITYKACYHTSSREEARRMLDYMDMEINAENENKLMALKNGQCLFKDLYGRIGILQFDAVFPSFKKLFSTTPKKQKGSEERE